MAGPAKPRNIAREIRELASDRRVSARQLPFFLTLTGATGACLFSERAMGLWLAFGYSAFQAALAIWIVVSNSRMLADTRPQERGKRSDDKALSRAQRSFGCLPILLVLLIAAAVASRIGRGVWLWEAGVVGAAGVVGHVLGISIIAWSRRVHAPQDRA
jgi:hypothetical protein